MAFDLAGARKAGYSDQEIASFLGQQSGFDSDAALQSGYSAGEIIDHLSALQPSPSVARRQPTQPVDRSSEDLTRPAGVLGRSIPAAPERRQSVGSVLEGITMPEPQFDAAEAARLSNREYAERTPIPGTPQPHRQSIEPLQPQRQESALTDVGRRLSDEGFLPRVAAQAVAGGVEGLGGIVRAAGEATGLDSVARFGAGAADSADALRGGLGQVESIEGFGPRSPAPYLTRMAEGAASSIAQTGVAGALTGNPIAAMTALSFGQAYNEGREAGLDPSMALARAVPQAAFEAAGERFSGLNKSFDAISTLLQRGAGPQARNAAWAALAQNGVREVPGELLTQAGQSAVDVIPGIGINPDMTMAEFLDGMRDAGIQAAMAGGGMGVAAHVGRRMDRNAGGLTPPPPAPSATNFTPADSSIAQAGITPVVVPNADAQTPTSVEAPAPAVTATGPAPQISSEETHDRVLSALARLAPGVSEPGRVDGAGGVEFGGPVPAVDAGVGASTAGTAATAAAPPTVPDASSEPDAGVAPELSAGRELHNTDTGDGLPVPKAWQSGAEIDVTAPSQPLPAQEQTTPDAAQVRADQSVAAPDTTPPQTRRDLVAIQDARLKAGEATRLEVVQPGDPTASQAVEMGAAFESPVTFVRDANGAAKFNGVNIDGRLYVNADAKDAPLAVATHEIVHSMPADIKAAVQERVMSTVTPEQRAAFMQSFPGYGALDRARGDEEMVAMFAQDEAKRPAFWQGIADKLGDGDFARFAKSVIDTLDRVLKGVRKQPGMERYTSDIQAVRDALTDAFAETKRRQKSAVVADSVDQVSAAFDKMPAREAISTEQGPTFSEQDPQAFVESPDGGTDFGEITPEMGRAMRRQAGKIRLQRGVQNADGTGHGLAHIEANHGKEIRGAGFPSVEAFVAHVAGNFNEVLQAAAGQLLVAVTDGRRDVMFIQLQGMDGGDFYRVNTAFPATRNYLERQERKGSKVLWAGSEPRPAVAGQQPQYAGGPDVLSGQGAPTARGNAESLPERGESTKSDGKTDEPRFSLQGAPSGRWLLERDELGRFRFAGGARLYNAIAGVARDVAVKLGLAPMSKDLARAVREMNIAIRRAQDITAAVTGELAKLTEDERSMISDIIEQELQAGVVPPQKILDIASNISAIMSQQSDELVRLGMMSQETADKHRDRYLPRFYESTLRKKPDPWTQAVNEFTGKPALMMGVKGKSLKRRGMVGQIDVADLPLFQSYGWQIDDPNFDPAQDQTVQIWRDYRRDEREVMGEIRDSMFRFAMGYMRTQKDIGLGKLFEHLASTEASRTERPGYVQVPNTTVSDTEAKTYGQLAGMWVPEEVLSHISKYEEGNFPALTAIYKRALSMWKEGRTVLNPVSHANNVLSNLTAAHFAGVSYWDAHKYAGAARDLVANGAAVQEARDAGLFLGTMTQEELMANMPEQLRMLAGLAENKVAKAADQVWNALAWFVRKPMGKAYEAEDLFFRYLVYRDARERGASPADAVDHSLKYIFAYDDLPKTARAIRDSALPFFSYTYKAIPMLAHTAMNYPWRLAGPGAAMWAVNAAMYAVAAGEDDEEWTTSIGRYITDPAFREKAREKEALERKNLPDWMKGFSALGTPKALRLGMDDVSQLPVFLDISRIFPGGDLMDMNNNTGGIPYLQAIAPSNPLLTTLMTWMTNRDPYFGKDFADKTDTTEEKAEKVAQYLWSQYAPAIAINNYHWDRAMNVIAAETGAVVKWWPKDYTGVQRDGQVAQLKYALMQTVGIKARPVDLEKSEAMVEVHKRSVIRELEKEMRSFRRQRSDGRMSDEQADREIERAREKRNRIREGLDINGNPLD